MKQQTNNTAVSLQGVTETTENSVVSSGVILSRLQDLVAWGRKNSVWPFNFGLSCCYVEMATSITSSARTRMVVGELPAYRPATMAAANASRPSCAPMLRAIW